MTSFDGNDRPSGGTVGGARAPAWRGQSAAPARQESTNLADILERVLDKGIVIAGDIRVNLLDIELLTIKLRLVVASVERAREMGIDWWEHDPTLSSSQRDLVEENRQLRDQVRELQAGEPHHARDQRVQHEPESHTSERAPEERGRG